MFKIRIMKLECIIQHKNKPSTAALLLKKFTDFFNTFTNFCSTCFNIKKSPHFYTTSNMPATRIEKHDSQIIRNRHATASLRHFLR